MLATVRFWQPKVKKTRDSSLSQVLNLSLGSQEVIRRRLLEVVVLGPGALSCQKSLLNFHHTGSASGKTF